MTTEKQFSDMGGEIMPEYHASTLPGTVRILERPDSCCDFEDLCGDMFNPDVNPEIDAAELKRQENEYADKVNSEGVYGYVAEFYDGHEWQETDSVWGFVGDDFNDSGYAPDLMRAAMDGLSACQTEQALDLEATRPDLYQH